MKKLSISLTLEQCTGTSSPIVVDVGEHCEWIRDDATGKSKRGARLGSTYTVLMQNQQCQHLIIRTPESQPVVSQEEVATACVSGQFLRISFEGFSGRPYSRDDETLISAKADRAIAIAKSPKN